ncbi:MAG: MlaD family protein [Elusimicrobiota bacterium]
MNHNDKKFKVGVFVVVALALLGFVVMKLGDVSFERTYKVYVYFDDISGLAAKSPVKIAGVEIGKVREIVLESGKARAELQIHRNVKLHADAKARVASTGIIGTKYLDLAMGSTGAALIKDGDSLQGTTLLGMEESVAKALESIRELTDSLKGPSGNDLGRNINSTVANLNAVTLSVREILDDRKNDISAALLSMRSVAGSLDQILEKVDRLVAKVEQGEGAVGALISDKKMGEDVKDATQNLKVATAGAAEMFGRFTRIRAFWDYRYRYDTKAKQGRSDFGIRLSPRPNKQYFLGVANTGDKKAPLKTEDFEKKNTFNLGLAQQFFPWVTLYAGLLKSEGGFGTDLEPFYAVPVLKKLSFNAEASSFGRDTTFNNRELKGAVYNAGVAAQVFPWLRLEARGEDLAEVKHFHGGVRFTLEDKDLAYLLGLVTATR